MPYESSSCGCSNPTITRCDNSKAPCLPYRCTGCQHTSKDAPADVVSPARQRRIWHASRVPSSLYMMNLASLTSSNIYLSNDNAVWRKQASYARYLNRLKSRNIRTTAVSNNPPITGNKTRAYGIIQNSKCICQKN